MKIEKLSSGHYRIQKQINGKRYSVTFEHKPTKREIESSLEKYKKKPIHSMTLSEAYIGYLEAKSNILSPSTIRGYITDYKRLSDAFCTLNIFAITQDDIQREINRIAGTVSPKTTRNTHGLISAILRHYIPGMVISTTLPQKSKSEPYIPSEDDVRLILEEIKDTYLYIPISLACYGLRRSEILALSISDLNDTRLTINKAAVIDKNNNLVIKPMPKTTASNRIVYISPDLADYIRKHGFNHGTYQYAHNSLSRGLKRVQKRLGIEEFSLHKMRHFFASVMLTKTDIQTVQDLGGWENSDTVRKIYAHSLANQKEKQQLMESLWNTIS